MKLKNIKNKKITIEDLAIMTKRGFDEIHKNFATKDNLKNFATKDDLKNFATKDDLKNFATKDDLKNLENKLENFATKDDLKNLENKLENFATKDEMLTGFDKILGKLDRMDQENIVHNYKHKKIDEILEIHDAKIKKLEIKVK